MQRTTVAITGMTCGHCVASVDRALKTIDGLTVEQVTIGQATVTHDPATVPTDRITQAIESEGYGVTVTR